MAISRPSGLLYRNTLLASAAPILAWICGKLRPVLEAFRPVATICSRLFGPQHDIVAPARPPPQPPAHLRHLRDIRPSLVSRKNRRANNRQAPFDAATQVTAKDIDMETVAQSGIRHGGSSLCGHGHRVKSFCPRKAALRHGYRPSRRQCDPRNHVLFTHWRQAAQCHLHYLRLIDLRLTRIPIRHIRMGTSSRLLLDNFDPVLPRRNDPS
jgi:hypothetical protein